ncbi:fatty acid hydroxylase superfamily protein [Nitzschia inconspicua]|uniref:Fatty acid hydroxylase superfamily protein n=1 Tax=Nitzschia inconspicua TaxID=303405 RepID=A0A9K3KS92_9STRA|nr:fatty acid hydroxylase superfamily protein [Nitzschia inconspicua]
MSDRNARQQMQGRILDTVTTLSVAYFLYQRPEFLNPWNLNVWQWILGGLCIRAAIAFYDHLVVFLVDSVFRNKLLPTRTTGRPVRYVELDYQSIIYLTINAIHEWVFVQRLCHFIWYSPHVSLNVDDIGLTNTVGALVIMFIVLDVCYAPCHHLLHLPAVYPLVHKHHHRQHFPTRGYLDAGNEHPIEHWVGVLCTWASVLSAVHLVKAHAIVLFAFFNIHAALAMLNHSPYDVQFFGYSVANHEMHHRKFTVNYAQYSMMYDHLMGTFAPYEGPKKVV